MPFLHIILDAERSCRCKATFDLFLIKYSLQTLYLIFEVVLMDSYQKPFGTGLEDHSIVSREAHASNDALLAHLASQWNWSGRLASQLEAPCKQEKSRTIGTDPAKYKTAICRNWEIDGVCNFRGCTFAHGKEELRLPRISEEIRSKRIDAMLNKEPMGLALNDPHSSQTTNDSSRGKAESANSVSRVDQTLQDLSDAIRRERESHALQCEENQALEILLRREEVYRLQRSQDQKEISDLQERVQHLENIIVKSHLKQESVSFSMLNEQSHMRLENRTNNSIKTNEHIPNIIDSKELKKEIRETGRYHQETLVRAENILLLPNSINKPQELL